MNLTLKQKALAQTVAMIAGAFLVAAVLNFIIANFGMQVIINAMALGVIAWSVYIFYSIVLTRLEYNESLKDLKKTFEKQ